MNELKLLLVLIISMLAVNLVGTLCAKYFHKKYSLHLYLFLSLLIAGPYYLMLKDGWLEFVGLEKTMGTVILIIVAIFYFPLAIARNLRGLRKLRKKESGSD